MKLYYFPGACSLASHIALREAGLRFELVGVDKHTKIGSDGRDLNQINPKSCVPALVLDSGEVLTENAVVLQYIADRNPAANLAPLTGTMERYRLMEWLNFLSSELHKPFNPLFRPEVSDGAKEYARANLTARLDYLQRALPATAFVMGELFTVADAYLFTVLKWGNYVNIDIGHWPQLEAYVARIGARQHVREALRVEGLVQ